jgi:hypothetical protein
MSICD